MNIVIHGVSLWNKYQLIVCGSVCHIEEMLLKSDFVKLRNEKCGNYLTQYSTFRFGYNWPRFICR